MARTYARHHVSTWDDKAFLALDLAHQGLLGALKAYPAVTYCGNLDWLPKRLSRCADGLTEARVVKMVGTLCESGHLILDAATDELFIRRFIADEEVLLNRNVAKSAARSLRKVRSPLITDVMVSELAEVWAETPKLPGWKAISEVDPDLVAEVEQHPLALGVGQC